MTLHRLYVTSLCTLAIAASACAGTNQNSPTGLLPLSGMAHQVTPQDHQGCQNDGGITVVPCLITFNSKNSGPVTVMVSKNGNGGKGGGRIHENDNCASRNIATIAAGSKGTYTVTAGTAMGVCDASFAIGQRNRGGDHGNGGNGQLHIVNKL
ncbi:MAG TPA: hypothetical protein VEW74_03495 [Candidatus Nitrosotalea sp.]|nr:hypothetical protein [Candidatus Nitrosotalea sp.]